MLCVVYAVLCDSHPLYYKSIYSVFKNRTTLRQYPAIKASAQYTNFKLHEESRHQISFTAPSKVLADVSLALKYIFSDLVNTAHLEISNSASSSCCGCKEHSFILFKKLSQILMISFFFLLRHSAVALDIFFVDKFTSTCKLSQENPEISAEYFVFSVQLFLKSRRKERNSNTVLLHEILHHLFHVLFLRLHKCYSFSVQYIKTCLLHHVIGYI